MTVQTLYNREHRKQRRRLRAISCSLLGLSLAACASARSGDSSSVRVLVYNIHAGKDAKGVDNLERVADIVRDTRADIVLLQEVDRGTARSGNVDQLARLTELTGYHGVFGKTLDYQGGEYGIAILSKGPISSDTLIRLPVIPPQHRSGVSYEPRGALRAMVATPGGVMAVINTHIDASREDVYRQQEARAIITLADSLFRGGGAVLVGGDLNSEPGSAVIELFTAAGWRDLWKECGAGPGLSFPAGLPVKRIDYLLASNEARCVSASVIATEVSDHRPALFEITVSGH